MNTTSTTPLPSADGPTLRPCRFCGSAGAEHLFATATRFDGGHLAHVQCMRCGAQGPSVYDEGGADIATTRAAQTWTSPMVCRQPDGSTDADGLDDLVMTCALAVLTGQLTVTVSATGKRPAGFPRGALLSVGSNGTHNHAVHPVRVLAWVYEHTTQLMTQRAAQAAKTQTGGHDGNVHGL
jgi:hypothetical protein